jgi:hypothetical protein
MIKELNFSSDEETEGTVVTEADIGRVSNTTGGEQGVWVNQKKIPIQIPVVCHVPHKIQIIMRSIEHIMRNSGMGALEFGVFLCGKVSDDGKMVLTEDFYVPQQKVSGATIDFEEEEPPDPKYNGVIHRHPNGCKGFSGTDSHFINRNFEFSLLYVDNDINIGVMNLVSGELRYQVPVQPVVLYPIVGLDERLIATKIQRSQSMGSSTSGNPTFGNRRDIRGLLIDPMSQQDEQMRFLDHTDVVEDIEKDNEDHSDVEEDNEELYICKKCGEVQWIDIGTESLCCESCDEELLISDFDLVNDLDETTLDWSTQEKIHLRRAEKD